RSATVTIEPPRRTFVRGLDPDDPTYSVTVVLPDIPLCAEHAFEIGAGSLPSGWCDDEHCRIYGEVGEKSPCGHRYEKLAPRKR
ncbi:MAG TPA: hypothetical protein VN648_00835, partial [Candidatus Methylomirabilis sp.]|nr:hypothetical protein [Candidatus Methylomirabilis sp.]